jgi:hypothetical protein
MYRTLHVHFAVDERVVQSCTVYSKNLCLASMQCLFSMEYTLPRLKEITPVPSPIMGPPWIKKHPVTQKENIERKQQL